MFSLSTLTLFGDSIQFCVKIAQSCLTLRNPMDYIVHEILQARILEWVAFPFSRGSSQNSNRIGLPHCRWSLYQLSHKGSPSSSIMSLKIRLQPDTSPLNHRLINPITLLNTVLTSLIGISDVVCVCARTQLHRTLCVPLHCSPPGSSVHGISQARILEGVAISYCKESSQHKDQTPVSYSLSQTLLLHQNLLHSHSSLF